MNVCLSVCLLVMDVWMYGCMDAWMHGCMDAWMHGCMDAWMYVCMYVSYSQVCTYRCAHITRSHLYVYNIYKTWRLTKPNEIPNRMELSQSETKKMG